MKLLIVIIVVIGVASVIAVIFIGNHTFEGIVAEKPYEEGLVWDKVRKDKAALGWVVDLSNKQFRKGDNELTLAVHDRDGMALHDVEVSVVVSRSSTSRYDRRYQPVRLADGFYRAVIFLPLRGQWDVRVEVSKSGKSAVFDHRIFADGEGS